MYASSTNSKCAVVIVQENIPQLQIQRLQQLCAAEVSGSGAAGHGHTRYSTVTIDTRLF